MIFFIDFDGTITRKDTCAAMVEAFARAGWEEINRSWEKKEISTVECANRTFALFDAVPDDLKKLLEGIEIDPYFKDFMDYCRGKDYPVFILSDGYDINIETILTRYGINVPYYANRLIYDGNFRIQCPNFNESCGNCGTCKTGLMDRLRQAESPVVYIGDGYSDTCASRHADQVFAKGSLYTYCRENGINVLHYDNFKDILSSLTNSV